MSSETLSRKGEVPTRAEKGRDILNGLGLCEAVELLCRSGASPFNPFPVEVPNLHGTGPGVVRLFCRGGHLHLITPEVDFMKALDECMATDYSVLQWVDENTAPPAPDGLMKRPRGNPLPDDLDFGKACPSRLHTVDARIDTIFDDPTCTELRVRFRAISDPDLYLEIGVSDYNGTSDRDLEARVDRAQRARAAQEADATFRLTYFRDPAVDWAPRVVKLIPLGG